MFHDPLADLRCRPVLLPLVLCASLNYVQAGILTTRPEGSHPRCLLYFELCSTAKGCACVLFRTGGKLVSRVIRRRLFATYGLRN